MPRLFEQGADVDPVLTHRVAMGLAANTTKNSTWATILAWLQANLSIPATPPTIQTIVNIGDWNMNSSAAGSFSVTVAHGIGDFTKIRRVTAWILSDGGISNLPIDSVTGSGAVVNGGVSGVDSTNVALIAKQGGAFDSNAYDQISFNRGYIVIESIP